MTSKRSTSSQADSPANLFRLRVDGKLRPIRVGSGRSSYASCLRYDPNSSSWRTYPDSSIGGWPRSLVIFPRAGTMLNGVAYRRLTLVRPTFERGSSSWPTHWPTPRANLVTGATVEKAKGRLGQHRLEDYAVVADKASGQLNPTWVEWLMGFPLGWTDLEDSETPSSPK